MKNGPDIRTIGGASLEEQDRAKQQVVRALSHHLDSLSPEEKNQFEKLEYQKSAKEVALIRFANEITSRLMQEAGIDPYDVPVNNLHIIPPELYTQLSDNEGTGVTFAIEQKILFNAKYFRDNPVHFGAVTLHELLHLKAHFSMEVEGENDEVKKTPYREGVAIRSLQSHGYHGRYHKHFDGLDEGIVAEMEKQLLGKLLEHPELVKERGWLASNDAREMIRQIATKNEIPEDDIFWVGEDRKDNWNAVSYIEQRAVLNYVCNEIQKQFPNEYHDKDQVFRLFINAHFTGRLLPIARLIEKTFGEGSFRLLGNMATDEESGILHLESMKKARARQMKRK